MSQGINIEERYVERPYLRVWTQSFGDPSLPLLIVMMGTAGQGVYWTKPFCELLAKEGFCVVRYDNRDTGLSTHIDFNRAPYRISDMADDVKAIIKAYGKTRSFIKYP